jgi:hypothetical protein
LLPLRNHAEGKTKARRIAAQKEVPHKNRLGGTVYWRVSKVCESVELFEHEFKDGKPKDGAQVYWRYLRAADPGKILKRDGIMNAPYLRTMNQ